MVLDSLTTDDFRLNQTGKVCQRCSLPFIEDIKDISNFKQQMYNRQPRRNLQGMQNSWESLSKEKEDIKIFSIIAMKSHICAFNCTLLPNLLELTESSVWKLGWEDGLWHLINKKN